MNEQKLKSVLHDCFAEIVEHLAIIGVHNYDGIQNMSNRVHSRIEDLTRPGSSDTLDVV